MSRVQLATDAESASLKLLRGLLPGWGIVGCLRRPGVASPSQSKPPIVLEGKLSPNEALSRYSGETAPLIKQISRLGVRRGARASRKILVFQNALSKLWTSHRTKL